MLEKNLMRIAVLSLLLLAVAIPLFAQQVGDANRNYVVNGIGANQPSLVNQTVPVPAVMSITYNTMDPGAPILWISSPNANPGQLVLGGGPTNSIDIGTSPFFGDVTVVANGTLPDFLNSLFVTGGNGTFTANISVPAVYAGTNLKFCMAHLAVSGPLGFWVSQVQNLTFALDPNLSPGSTVCNPAATVLVQGDDTSVNVALGFTFPFYGVNYTNLFVGSNGVVTSLAFTTFTESVTTFLSATGGAKICPWWDDFNFNSIPPSGTASCTFFTDNASTAEICWTNVSEYGVAPTNSNTFKCTLIASAGGNAIIFDYGAMAALDGLVGLSPGVAGAVGQTLNLSVGPNAINAGQGPNQLFTAASPNDLVGYQITWVLDANGVPTLQY
jgi:hypothetical protein